MSFKKMGAIFLVAMFIFTFPFTASAAEKVTYKGTQSFAVQGNTFNTSGTLKICTNDANTYILKTSNDKKVGTKKLAGKNKKCGTFNNLKKGKYYLQKEMVGSPIIDAKKAKVKFYD